jgi:hypothetical protein
MASGGGMIFVHFNGHKVPFQANKLQVGHLLAPFMDQLEYMSSEAILRTMYHSARLLVEVGVCKRQAAGVMGYVAKLLKTNNPHEEFDIRYVDCPEHPAFRKKVIDVFCEYVLRCDGMGRVRGAR